MSTCHCYREIEHIDATNRVVLETIKSGPYAGQRMAAHVYRDPRRISGRRPYGGHVWRKGSRWIVSLPGGSQGASFATMREAKAYIAEQDRWT